MAARQQVLDKTDLFGTLPPELLGQLRDRTALARLHRGDVIFEKGDPATSLYVVFSGRVAIAAKAADGRESVISVLGPGALFGEMSMFDGGVRSAHARALTTVHLIAVALRRRARGARRTGPTCSGPSCASSPAACAPPTRRSPTRCSST